jgi:hypothetical protein
VNSTPATESPAADPFRDEAAAAEPDWAWLTESGMDLIADAIAAVRCCATGDAEGLQAVVNGCDHPRALTGMIAVLASSLLKLGGAEGADAEAVLGLARHAVSDMVLDLPRPQGEVMPGGR